MTNDEFWIYLKVKHEFQMEDAAIQIAMLLDIDDFSDLPEEMQAKFDLNLLADRFEDYRDCNLADNDTWDYILSEYIIEKEIDVRKYVKE